MKNLKNKRTIILAIILVGLLIVAYKVVFMPSTDGVSSTDQNIAAGERAVIILKQIEGINFDTSIITDPKFRSLQSIETPLPTLPIGKKNPFSASAN